MKLFYKLSALFLCALLLMPCLTVSVYAAFDGDELEPDTDPYRDSKGNVRWGYSYDDHTIRGLGREYTYYEPSQKLLYDAPTRYYFENEITVDDTETPIYGYSDNPEILEMSFWTGLYVTEAGRISLDALCNGNAATYRLRSGNSSYYAERSEPLEEGFAQSLTQGMEKKTFKVTALKDAIVCYVYGYDGTDAYACAYGGVYKLGDSYYYVHYLTLGNQHFDADGNFSYRSGAVEATLLDDTQASRIATLVPAMKTHTAETVWEGKANVTGPSRSAAISLFVVGMIIFGFVFPLPLLIVGIFMARSRVRGYPKYWYALSAVAVLWMIAALAVMILLL